MSARSEVCRRKEIILSQRKVGIPKKREGMIGKEQRDVDAEGRSLTGTRNGSWSKLERKRERERESNDR